MSSEDTPSYRWVGSRRRSAIWLVTCLVALAASTWILAELAPEKLLGACLALALLAPVLTGWACRSRGA